MKIKFNLLFLMQNGIKVFQNQSIDQALNKNFNLFVLRTVSTNMDEIGGILNKIEQKNIPLILLHEETTSNSKFT